MPKVDIYFKFYTGDYLRGTMHLTRELHGSYILLMIAYWDNGGPLLDDDDHLATTAKCPPADWPRTRKILSRFFNIGDGLWKHKRIEAELLKAQAESDAKSEAAKRTNAKRTAERTAQCPQSESASESKSKSNSVSRSKGKAKASNILPAPTEGQENPKDSLMENHLMTRCRMTFGTAEMEENGGLWRTRIREDWSKLVRCLDDLDSQLKEGAEIPNKAAYVTDLWKRFA